MFVAARYINRELLLIFVVTLAMLLLVAIGGRFISYLQEAALGKFTGDTVLMILALRLPEFVQLTAPFALFIATLLTFSRLYADQEMVILQTGGASSLRILTWVSASLVLIAVVVGCFSFYLTPSGAQELERFLAAEREQSELELLNPGAFHIYDYGKRVSYSEGMSSDRRVLRNVFIAQTMDDGRELVLWARTGTQEVDVESNARMLVLQTGDRYEIPPADPGLTHMRFEGLRQRLQTLDHARRGGDVQALASDELGTSAEERAEWHWRLGLPMFCLIGGLLALGVAKVGPRQGRFARVVPGVLVMLLYYLALLLNRNFLAEGTLPPLLGFWVVHGLALGVGLRLLLIMGRPRSA
ncbi:MAG: LPS export ABC transporter permease LptF [Pseudomonadota bacterium]